MLDMKFLRENPDLVKENIKKKFQDEKRQEPRRHHRGKRAAR